MPAHAMTYQPHARPALGSVRLGDLDRVEPISGNFGGDRGTPVDRYYIDGFLARHARDIRGRVIEIGDNAYTQRFGGDRVTRSDVLDIDGDNPNATFVADLTDCNHVPSASFDCFILTQTLHMIYDVRAVLRTVYRLLVPGGVVLVTIPCISQIDRGSGRDTWFWYMTPRCARLVFEEAFAPEGVSVEAHGNVLAAIAFLQGLALEEMDRQKLDVRDPFYPLISTVRAVKPGRRPSPV
jgi:SAM-dependent methyltransferase